MKCSSEGSAFALSCSAPAVLRAHRLLSAEQGKAPRARGCCRKRLCTAAHWEFCVSPSVSATEKELPRGMRQGGPTWRKQEWSRTQKRPSPVPCSNLGCWSEHGQFIFIQQLKVVVLKNWPVKQRPSHAGVWHTGTIIQGALPGQQHLKFYHKHHKNSDKGITARDWLLGALSSATEEKIVLSTHVSNFLGHSWALGRWGGKESQGIYKRHPWKNRSLHKYL